ncbi:hypothetical protein PUF88_04505 [Lactobacillaceae bacterium L1_55_11]|nr:hypothetical protein [Lactobacillaceae bacterium L1_55_11]
MIWQFISYMLFLVLLVFGMVVKPHTEKGKQLYIIVTGGYLIVMAIILAVGRFADYSERYGSTAAGLNHLWGAPITAFSLVLLAGVFCLIKGSLDYRKSDWPASPTQKG